MSESPTTRHQPAGLAGVGAVCRAVRAAGVRFRSEEMQDADAADIAQDVLRSVAQQMRQWQFDPQRSSLRGGLASSEPVDAL